MSTFGVGCDMTSYLGQRCSRSLYNPYCEHQECLKVKVWVVDSVESFFFFKSLTFKFCSICPELKARPFRLVTILMMFIYDLYHIQIMYMIIEQFNCIYSQFLIVEIWVKWTLQVAAKWKQTQAIYSTWWTSICKWQATRWTCN